MPRRKPKVSRAKSVAKKAARPYPLPTKWPHGFVSRAQAAYFQRNPKTRKYVPGMTYDIRPVGHGKAASKIARLPKHVRGGKK